MSDIFVSYANEDQGRVKPLLRALEDMGWSVFWDRTIPVGGTWRQVIGSEIDTCRCMVVVWSKHSVDSDWVHEEADEGKRRGVLAPVRIDHILPPFGFRSIQAAKLADWDGTAPSAEFDRLLADLSNILGTSPAKLKEEQQRQAELEVARKAKEEGKQQQHQESQRKAESAQHKQEAVTAMSDIFISYKREEQPVAKKLADALERAGWGVWWDPRLRAGEHFDDVIEEVLQAARCVVVLWSKKSVKSHYVKYEASYALRRNKLVPVAIEAVDLPFSFKGLHTEQLTAWEQLEADPVFLKLEQDITAIVGDIPTGNESAPEVPPKKVIEKLTSGVIFRDTLTDGSEGPEMVVVPAGSFRMGDIQGGGDQDELPVHEVSIARPFALGRYAVTFDEYDRFTTAVGRELPDDEGWGRGRQPVINVSWEDAVPYAQWLAKQTGKRYRLPSEAEWEYAVRAGTETDYWWGDDIRQDGKVWANCDGCGSQWDEEQTAPVGSFVPNVFGLHDMFGNVWEYLQDCWHDNYNNVPKDGSAWLKANGGNCGLRVLRSGSWCTDPGYLRSSNRYWSSPDDRDYSVGFRLARDLD